MDIFVGSSGHFKATSDESLLLILPGHSYFGPFSSRQGGSALCVCMAVSNSDDTRCAFRG